jgi:hypothetical protein
MTGATFLQSLAAHLAYMEGKAHGTNAQLAILFCLRNRIAANWEDGDLGRIIQSVYFMNIEGVVPDIPDVRNPDFQQILGYTEGIFDNSIQDRLTSGALFWGVKKPLGAKERVAQVSTLNFWS